MSLSKEQARAACREAMQSGFDTWLRDRIVDHANNLFHDATDTELLHRAKCVYEISHVIATVIADNAK